MKYISYKRIFTLTLAASTALSTMPVYALPQGGNVAAGSVQIDAPSGGVLNIHQQTDKGVIDWQSFDIGTGEKTEFFQPNNSSITLNRVVGGDLSQIMGELKANGQIFLVNPNGIVFGSGAVVDVNGLLATTTDISNENFMNGQFIFDTPGSQNAAIENRGTITAAEGGLIALVAPQVTNSGILQAKLGKISLYSGNKYTVDLYGDELINLAVDDTVATTLEKQIENSGNISAEGGMVILAASQATSVLDSVVNMDGIIDADSATIQGGKIVINGGNGLTRINGTLSAQGDTGGAIDVLGDMVIIRENADINASGVNGGGAIHIGGEYQGKGDTPTATLTGVASGAVIKADAVQNGDGGEVIVWADDTTAFYGNISAEGGKNSGNGGFVEVSGSEMLTFEGEVSTRAPNGEMGMLLLDPKHINIIDGAGPGADDAEVTGDGVIASNDGGGGATFVIAEQSLEGIAAGTNINLQAKQNITMADLTDNSLDLASTGIVYITADADTNGSGTFSMDASDSITTGGALLQIAGDTIVVGGLDTSAGAGAISVNATGGGVTLYGDMTTNTGSIGVTGATTLGANVNLSTGVAGGNITLNDTVDGAFDLSLDAGTGNVVVNDNLGSTTDLNSFTASGAAITLADVTTTLGQTYNDPLTLTGTLTTNGANILFNDTVALGGASGADTGAGAGNITFVSTLDGTQNFTASAGTGDVSYGAAVGGGTSLANITTTAANISMAAAVTTTGDQTYNGATTVIQNMTSGGALTFTGSVVLGANRLFTSGGGVGDDITFSAAISEDFDVSMNAGSGDIYLTDADVNSLTLTGATLDINGDIISDSAMTFGGVSGINISGASTMTAFDVTDQDITFGVANVLGGGNNLTLNGDTVTVEQVSSLGNFAINANTATNLNDSITTTGTQTYTGATTIASDLTTTNNNILFNDAVTFTGDSIMSTGAGAGNITFSTTLDDAINLTTNAGTGNVVFTGAVGSITPLTSLTATGTNITGTTIATSGNQTFTGATSFTGTISAGGNIDVTGALTAGSTVTSTGGTIAVSGLATLNDNVTTTNQNIDLTGGIALNATPIAIDTGAGAGNITLGGAVDGATDLTASAGTGSVTSTGAIGGVTPLLSFTASGSGGLNLADVTTVAAQTYSDNLTLNGTLTTSNNDIGITGTLTLGGASGIDTGAGAGNFSVSGAVDGANTFTIDVGTGTVTFSSAVGGVTPLSALTVTAASSIDTLAVSTSGNQDYTTTGDATFAGTLTTTAGTLDVTANNIDTQAVSTSGTQTYNATTNLAFNQAVSASAGGVTATAGGTFDAISTVTTSGNQDYNITGDATFADTVTTTGGTLDVDGDNISMQLVNTTGTQTYTATTNVTFNQNLTASAGGVTASGVDITTQAVTTTGNQSYTGTGAVTANNTLNATAGTIALSGNTIDVQSVTSSGNQTYTATVDTTLNQDITSSGGSITMNGDVTILADRIITSGGGAGQDIAINGTIDDDFNLTLNAGAGGDIAVDVLDINSLILTGNLMNIGGDITTDTAMDFTTVNGITLSAHSVLTANSGVPEDITFDAANVITGNRNLTLNGDTITLYRINGVRALDVTGATAITLNDTVSTNNTQTYTGLTTVTNNLTTTNDNILFNSNVTLTGDSVMSTGTGAGNITFSGTLDGGQALTASAGTGNVVFTGAVGGVTPLTSLTATGTTIDTNVVDTTGDQTYTGTTTIDGDLTSTTGAITITGNATLASNSDLTSGAGAGDDITITGSTTGDFTLGIIAGLGDVTMGGADIDTWNLTSGQQLNIGNTFITDTAMDFTNMDNIVLTADTILRAYNGTNYQDVTFDAANIITGAYDLTIEGDTLEIYQIGDGVTNPVDLALTAASFININDTIQTSGNQTYTAPTLDLLDSYSTPGGDITFNTVATMVGDVTMDTGSGGGNILFTGTVNGTYDLNLTAGTGTVIAQADMGTTTPLNTFTVNSASDIEVQQVITVGAQSYGGPVTLNGDLTTTDSDLIFTDAVTLGADVSLDTGSGAGNIDFQSTLDGTYDLTMDAGLGNIDWRGNVGATSRLGDVLITDVVDMTMHGTSYVESFTQTYGTGTTSYGWYDGIDANGAINIDTTPNIDGRIIRAADTVLRGTESVTGEVHVRSLVLAASNANLYGTVNGKTDRDAARLVDLETFTPGPYFFNQFALPVVGDVIAADTIFTDDAFTAGGNVRVSLNNVSSTREMLSPFWSGHQLLVPAGEFSSEYENVEYLNTPLWEYIELNIFEEQE